MKGCLIAAGIVLLVLALAGGCVGSTYNTIVGDEARVESSWHEIQNQYQRRSELVPQLVATVQGAAEFEQSTLTEITEARASVGKLSLPASLPEDPAQLEAFFQAQDRVSGALQRLLVVAENYPTLKASQNFLSLQDQLEGTENRLATARRDYIEAVRAYNVSIRRFPGALVAGAFGFEAHPQLETPAGSSERPQVEFEFGK